MRALTIANTAVDLTAQALPFQPGNTVVALNASGSSRVVQGSVDQAFTSPVTLATIADGASASISLDYDFIRVSSAGNVVLLQN